MKKFTILITLLSFHFFLIAQTGVLSCYQNPINPNGSGGDIAAKIVANYKLYVIDKTAFLDIEWNIKPTDYLFWDGKKYTIQQLGSNLFSELSISKNIVCVADAFYEGRKLCEVEFDASGCQSPNTYSRNPIVNCTKQPIGFADDKVGIAIWKSGKVSFQNLRLKESIVTMFTPYPMVPNAIKAMIGDKPAANNNTQNSSKNKSSSSNQNKNNQSATKQISSTINSSTQNRNTVSQEEQYNKNINEMQNAMSNGNYVLAQEALRKANNIKPVQNYQSLFNSMDALNNYSKTGSTLSLVEQQKLEVYGKIATTSVQIIGDWVKRARERKEREAQEKKIEDQRMIALKTPIYFSELAKSQTNVLYEKETILQNALTEAYNAPLGKINIDMIFSFEAQLFVPQQIKLPGLTINSYADKVNYIKNGSEQTLTGENVYGPKLFLNPSKSKLLIAYYTSAGTDGKIALQVYDLAGIRKIGNAITFEGKFQKYNQPLGFGLSDDEIVFSEFSAKSFSNRIEIVVYNYNIGKEVKRIKSEKLSGGFLGFRDEFQYNKIINSRFVMGVSTYKDFYQLIDLQTEQSVVLPKIIIDDCLNYGGAKSDTILVLGTSTNMIYNSIITFNNLYKHFTKDEIKNFNTNKIKNDVYSKSLGNFFKLLIGVFYVDSLSGPSEKNLEDCFVNKVYSENNSENKFFKGDRDPTFVGADGPRTRINCPYDLMLFNSISLTKTNTYFKTRQIEETDENKIIGIIDDKLYAYGFIENKLVSDKYQLDYYPLRIIDAQKEYVTIFGIDKYAFPIIKKYDIKKIFEKYTSSIAVTEIKSKTSNETTIPVTKKSTETSKKSSKASLGCKNYTSDDVDLWREKNAVEIKYLEMVNTTKKALKLEFYHPDSKSKFSDFYINPGQRVYFLSEGLKVGIGNDWGIKLASNKNKNCIYFLGDLVTVRDTDFILDVSKIPGD